MCKLYLFISLFFIAHVSLGMQVSCLPLVSKNNFSQEKQRVITYSSKINTQKKQTVEQKTPIKPIKNSFASSMVQKPHHVQEKKQEKFQFIYDEKTARRGAPKMLDIHCDQCDDLLIQYQKDGPGRLLRCYLDRIHNPKVLKNRQYELFNVRTSPYLACETCRSVIGIPMIYRGQSEERPAYKMKENRFYIKESK